MVTLTIDNDPISSIVFDDFLMFHNKNNLIDRLASKADKYGKRDPLSKFLDSQYISKYFSWRCSKEYHIRNMASFYQQKDKESNDDLSTLENSESKSLEGGGGASEKRSKDNGMIYDYEVYKCTRFCDGDDSSSGKVEWDAEATGGSSDEKGAGNEEVIANTSARIMKVMDLEPQFNLKFDSNFESGNLDRAVRVMGRDGNKFDAAPPSYAASSSSKLDVSQEYDLTIRNDLYTSGNIQWYYFSAQTPDFNEVSSSGGADAAASKPSYPIRVRFNITNMQKEDSLYNYGMKPVVFSITSKDQGWIHGCDEICYYQNEKKCVVGSGAKKKVRNKYTLTFCYTFQHPDRIYLAHTYPYTYTDLQRYLAALEQDDRVSDIMRRNLLSSTLAGNRCDLLIITGRSNDAEASRSKPAVVVSARVHPGETNASYMMHGLIDFLTSEAPEAELLRRHFVFKIVPMLNPDGVIHGNYRCCLAGTDMNRRYRDGHAVLHAPIVSMKALLASTHQTRGVLLYLDLHGHSRKKNAFLYGCDLQQFPEKHWSEPQKLLTAEKIEMTRIHNRIFPTLLSTMSSHFQFNDCRFGVSKSKLGTGRVFAWRECGIQAAYTIELSFCGTGDNGEAALLKKAEQCRQGAAKKPSPSELIAQGFEEFVGRYVADLNGYTMQQRVLDLSQQHMDNYHFSRDDFRNMGRDMALAILEFANIREGPCAIAASRPTSLRSRGARGSFSSVSSAEGEAGALEVFDELKVPLVEYIQEDSVDSCVTAAGIYSSAAIRAALAAAARHGGPAISKRMEAEIALRQSLPKTFDLNFGEVFSAPPAADGSAPLALKADFDNESAGSDSEPSVDNVPVTRLLRNMKKFADTKSIVLALRKVDKTKVLKDNSNTATLNRQLQKEKVVERGGPKEHPVPTPPATIVQTSFHGTFRGAKRNTRPQTSLRKRAPLYKPPEVYPQYKLVHEVSSYYQRPLQVLTLQLDKNALTGSVRCRSSAAPRHVTGESSGAPSNPMYSLLQKQSRDTCEIPSLKLPSGDRKNAKRHSTGSAAVATVAHGNTDRHYSNPHPNRLSGATVQTLHYLSAGERAPSAGHRARASTAWDGAARESVRANGNILPKFV